MPKFLTEQVTRIAPSAPPPREEFLEGDVRSGTPILMKGLVKDWPAVECWTPDYLAGLTASMGDIQVPYRSTPSDMPRIELARIQRGKMSLLELLTECSRSPDGDELYVPGLDLPQNTSLARDVGIPSMLTQVHVYATTVFLGRNTQCLGHYHPKTQALLCQVQGIKRVWMYSPDEMRKLYVFPFWSQTFFQSQVNYYGDRTQFPRLTRARCQEFELHPGDALFIPLHWLHVPEGKGWNLSVTHWWRPSLREWTYSFATARTLLGIGCEAIRQLFYKRRWLH